MFKFSDLAIETVVANSSETMEPRNHFNGASPKSHKSRGNFLRVALTIIATLFVIASFAQDEIKADSLINAVDSCKKEVVQQCHKDADIVDVAPKCKSQAKQPQKSNNRVVGLIWLFITFVYIPLMCAVYLLARRYGRNEYVWVLGSLFLNPVICIVILWCCNETEKKRKERIIEEELLREWSRKGDLPTASNILKDEIIPDNSQVVELKTGKQYKVIEVDNVRRIIFCFSDVSMTKKAFFENEIWLIRK